MFQPVQGHFIVTVAKERKERKKKYLKPAILIYYMKALILRII